MNEVIKNIGLGIFVNGAFAWQFAGAPLEGALAVVEGIIIMYIATKLKKKGVKTMSSLFLILSTALTIGCIIAYIKAYKKDKKHQH